MTVLGVRVGSPHPPRMRALFHPTPTAHLLRLSILALNSRPYDPPDRRDRGLHHTRTCLGWTGHCVAVPGHQRAGPGPVVAQIVRRGRPAGPPAWSSAGRTAEAHRRILSGSMTSGWHRPRGCRRRTVGADPEHGGLDESIPASVLPRPARAGLQRGWGLRVPPAPGSGGPDIEETNPGGEEDQHEGSTVLHLLRVVLRYYSVRRRTIQGVFGQLLQSPLGGYIDGYYRVRLGLRWELADEPTERADGRRSI